MHASVRNFYNNNKSFLYVENDKINLVKFKAVLRNENMYVS